MDRKIYNYCAVIGVDGMGNFNRQAATPCMDKIFKMVSRVTFIAYAVTFVMFLFYPLNKKRLEDLQAQLTEQRAKRMESLAAENAEG